MDSGIECTPRKAADDAKLSSVANSLEGKGAIQRKDGPMIIGTLIIVQSPK